MVPSLRHMLFVPSYDCMVVHGNAGALFVRLQGARPVVRFVFYQPPYQEKNVGLAEGHGGVDGTRSHPDLARQMLNTWTELGFN